MSEDPIARFSQWLADAHLSEPNDPNAVALATVDAHGRPSVRMVLLKEYDRQGFVFYTNQTSRKASEIAANPQAAMLFHWKTLRRQVRVEGAVTSVSKAEADAYFATRGRASQLGAWASNQSSPLEDRSILEARLTEVTERFAGRQVPRPPFWSGYRVAPACIEFWSDGEHRLHHRERFIREPSDWQRELLFP